MITQNQIKLINSLAKKKYRDINQLFIAEGQKLVEDLLSNDHPIDSIFATKEWFGKNKLSNSIKCIETSSQYLKKISQLKTASPVVAICKTNNTSPENIDINNELIIALDDIQDPGNLGTIIRLADWFGIKNIVCSNETVDVYNPKVVQATMGAISRVNIHYTNLVEYIEELDSSVPVYGTFLDGDNIYESNLSKNGVVIMGNEGKGISNQIGKLVNKRILIPNFSAHEKTSESLNVSMATAITLSEFRRNY